LNKNRKTSGKDKSISFRKKAEKTFGSFANIIYCKISVEDNSFNSRKQAEKS